MSIDEKIAKLERAKKVLEEEAKNASAKNEEVNEKEDELTQEEINNAINSGFLEIENRKFEFMRKTCLGGNIEIPIIEEYFELVLDTDDNFVLKNDEGVSIVCNATASEKKINSLDFKKMLEDNFRKMELYIQWLEEDSVQVDEAMINYYTFLTPTALGVLYNLVFFYNKNNKNIVGNFNCPNKDVKLWEKVFKGMVELITV